MLTNPALKFMKNFMNIKEVCGFKKKSDFGKSSPIWKKILDFEKKTLEIRVKFVDLSIFMHLKKVRGFGKKFMNLKKSS